KTETYTTSPTNNARADRSNSSSSSSNERHGGARPCSHQRKWQAQACRRRCGSRGGRGGAEEGQDRRAGCHGCGGGWV
ncbi:hypothetical protein LTR16_001598, partial [Cryomyces antarcticus]